MKRKNKFFLISIILALFCSLSGTFAYFSSKTDLESLFKAKGYVFKLNAGEGKFSSSDISISKGKTNLPIPARNGYTFSGYSKSTDGNIDYSNNIIDVNDINNREIYAMWKINTYRITYNLNGGSISGQKTSYNVEESFTLPTPTKTGFSFLGWTGSNIEEKQLAVTIPSGTTGDLNFLANWDVNKYVIDINPIIQNITYDTGLNGFTFSVWINGILVAENVTDYYNNQIDYGSTIRVYVNEKEGYSITSFKDYTWTVTDSFVINPSWYDNIPPTITSFHVENLGYYNPSNKKQGWNIRVYIDGYDNGTGIQKFQTWLVPYGNGSGASRVDGNERTIKNVLYLDSTSGRTFCAYAIDNANNEASKCDTIRIN